MTGVSGTAGMNRTAGAVEDEKSHKVRAKHTGRRREAGAPQMIDTGSGRPGAGPAAQRDTTREGKMKSATEDNLAKRNKRDDETETDSAWGSTLRLRMNSSFRIDFMRLAMCYSALGKYVFYYLLMHCICFSHLLCFPLMKLGFSCSRTAEEAAVCQHQVWTGLLFETGEF